MVLLYTQHNRGLLAAEWNHLQLTEFCSVCDWEGEGHLSGSSLPLGPAMSRLQHTGGRILGLVGKLFLINRAPTLETVNYVNPQLIKLPY